MISDKPSPGVYFVFFGLPAYIYISPVSGLYLTPPTYSCWKGHMRGGDARCRGTRVRRLSRRRPSCVIRDRDVRTRGLTRRSSTESHCPLYPTVYPAVCCIRIYLAVSSCSCTVSVSSCIPVYFTVSHRLETGYGQKSTPGEGCYDSRIVLFHKQAIRVVCISKSDTGS